ncbi:MAG: LamG-like jellyroll fold domain-containing protein [Candidatus Peribacter sp.]
MQKPSLLKERPLRLEPLEEKQMLSGTALAAVQQDTAYLANAVLRSEPVEFLSGEKDFNGSGMDCIADSPVFTNGSFSLETQIRVDAIRQQSFITKYDSGAGDQSFHFCMLKDGRLQFDVYGNPPSSSYLTFRTTGTPLAVGQWQSVRASFDLEHRQLAIMVDGQDVAGEIIQTGADITAIHDGSTDVRVAGRRTGGGPGNYADAAFRDMSFYPVASFEEGMSVPVQEQQATAAAIDAVLRAEPVELLPGEMTFNGSQNVRAADSPVFTDGSFAIDISVCPASMREQTIISKYNTQQSNPDQGFLLTMLADGKLQFIVYQEGGGYRLWETTGPALAAGTLQRVQARFDIKTQQMTIIVDDREIAGALGDGSKDITKIRDGTSDVRAGVVTYGGGDTNKFGGMMKDGWYYPVDTFGIPETAGQEPESEPPPADSPPAEAEAVTEEQQLTAEAIDAVLRSEPVVLLAGTKEFDGSAADVATIADSPVFTDGSFTVETGVKVNAIRQQTILSKYDSSRDDRSFALQMLGDGRLQFDVYGNPSSQNYLSFRTTGTPLTAGQLHAVRASFDLEHRQLAIMVDGKEVPGTLIKTGADITALHDGTSPVRLGAAIYGSGALSDILNGELRDARFYTGTQAGVPESSDSEAPPADSPPAEAEPTLGATEDLAQLKLAVMQVLQDMLTAEESESVAQTLADAPDLGGAYLQNGLWKLNLASLGGNAAILTWQGHGTTQQVKPLTGEEGRQAAIAAGVIVEEQHIDTTPTLVDVLDLPEGIQTDANGIHHTVHVETAELGKVCVCVDDGRKSINLVNRNGNIGGEGSGYQLGQAGLSLEFEDGPQYVQWIDLKRLSGSTSVKVYVWDAQGVVRTLWASESGRLQIDGTVRIMATYPEQQSSAWVIQAINTDPIVPPPAFEETWMQASGELVGIDLSDTEQAVQSAELTVFSDRPQNTIQAIAYRGAERIAAQAVGEDGSVRFEDATGITSVLLVQSDPNATLYVTDIAVSGLEGSVPPAAAALSPMSNADVALSGARQWEHGTFNAGDIAVRNGVLMNRGGYENRVNGRMLFQTGIPVNSQTQYTRYDLYTTSGSVSIAGLWYVDSDGLHRVPQEYWTVVGNCLVTAPGGPGYPVIEMSGNGTFDVGTRMGDHAADVMPSQEMALRSTVLVVRKVGATEGFSPVPPTVSSANEHARAGCTVNMFYQILNDGLGSGPITVKIRVGQTGTTEDPVTRTFTGEIRGMSTIGVSVDITLQEDNDFATMEVIGPDGQSSLAKKQVQPPKLAGTRTREEIEPIILEKARALTVAYWQGRLSDAHSEEEADNARQKLAALGIGDGGSGGAGSTTDALTEKEKELVAMANAGMDVQELIQVSEVEVSAPSISALRESAKGTMLAEVSGWYQDTTPNDLPSIDGERVREDSTAGRVFLGFWQNAYLWRGNPQDLLSRCVKIEAVTGVNALGLYGLARHADYERFTDGMRYLFTQAGFGHIFLPYGPVNQLQPLTASLADAQGTYLNGCIRVGLDHALLAGAIKSIQVYASGSLNGTEIHLGSQPIAVTDPNKLFIDAPVAEIGRRMAIANYAGPVYIKVAAWLPEKETDGVTPKHLTSVIAGVDVRWDGTFDNGIKDPSTFSTKNGDLLTEEQVKAVRDALAFDDLASLPTGNRQILQRLIDDYLNSGQLRYDTEGYVGPKGFELESTILHGGGQCKEWVYNLIENATGVTVPLNDEADYAKWEEKTDARIKMVEKPTSNKLSDQVQSLRSGDIIQMNWKNVTPHTMVVGKIEEDGIWVFDSNWGDQAEFDENGNKILDDETLRYRFVSFDSFEQGAQDFTTYRIDL